MASSAPSPLWPSSYCSGHLSRRCSSAGGACSFRSKADVQAERDPVGVLAGDVAAVNQVDIYILHRRIAQSQLRARLADAVGRADRQAGAGLPEHLTDQRERLDESPFEAGAPSKPVQV